MIDVVFKMFMEGFMMPIPIGFAVILSFIIFNVKPKVEKRVLKWFEGLR